VYGEGFDTWNERPSACLAKKGASGQYIAGGSRKGGTGTNFAYYTFQNGYFHTIIPPNGPSCSWTNGTSLGQWAAIFPPTSYHGGGVNACLADGSVRLISDTIHPGTLTEWFRYRYRADNRPDEPTGNPSPFGPWGALGSMNGGESSAL